MSLSVHARTVLLPSPPVEAAGAAGRVLVEDEGLAGPRIGPADVAVVAAALEVAGHAAVEGLGQRAHHRGLHAVLHLDHAAARRGGIRR